MRVNIYAEEMTDRVEIISKEIDGHTFTGLRLYLELPVTLANGVNYRGPFMHRPGDDDSAAITFWGKRDLRVVLRKMMTELDAHYGKQRGDTTPGEIIQSTENEKHLAFEWLRMMALSDVNGSRNAAIVLSEIARLTDGPDPLSQALNEGDGSYRP